MLHPDHLGTPQVITDENQTVVWKADYTPFGQANITTETITNNLRFPGQYFDQETNLHYNFFRDYDPSTGRYIESDPIGLTGGINTYLYVSANPFRFIDPLGLLDPNSEEHLYRNRYNRCPSKPPEKDCEGNYKDSEGRDWEKDNPLTSGYYHGGWARGYETWRAAKGSANAGSQCTYDSNDRLVDYGPYQGTYDYGEPGTPEHIENDVNPHGENWNYEPEK